MGFMQKNDHVNDFHVWKWSSILFSWDFFLILLFFIFAPSCKCVVRLFLHVNGLWCEWFFLAAGLAPSFSIDGQICNADKYLICFSLLQSPPPLALAVERPWYEGKGILCTVVIYFLRYEVLETLWDEVTGRRRQGSTGIFGKSHTFSDFPLSLS